MPGTQTRPRVNSRTPAILAITKPLAILVAAAASVPMAVADTGTLTVLHTFTNTPDGAGPAVGISTDAAGDVYGTTIGGGDPTCSCGTVFKVAPNGTESILLSFKGSNGATPYSVPFVDKSDNLYGTTYTGGAGLDGGQGTIFKIDANGKASLLYSFCTTSGCPDGGNPVAGLIADTSGNLYGVGQEGGTNGNGVVFELTAGGSLKVLYSFDYGTSGAAPDTALIRDSSGNLYGATCCGGSGGQGTIFKLSSKGKESTLFAFPGDGSSGSGPGGLVMDSLGNLYGTTGSFGEHGHGTVFRLAADGTETVLYAFKGKGDGGQPTANSPLVLDAKGNLYGATTRGGTGAGVLFRVTPAGKETVLHTFDSGSDGSGPNGGLVFHKRTFYGAAMSGGDGSGCGSGACGTVFAYVK